jgi:hypothetical protein
MTEWMFLMLAFVIRKLMYDFQSPFSWNLNFIWQYSQFFVKTLKTSYDIIWEMRINSFIETIGSFLRDHGSRLLSWELLGLGFLEMKTAY